MARIEGETPLGTAGGTPALQLLAYSMDIADWRKKIDEIDAKLVQMLNQRARAAQEIGRLKRMREMPIYEPDRERIVLEQVQEQNQGPLQHKHLIQIYERIMDVMRNVQKDEIVEKDRGDGK